jgi:Domain of unknown function (DUF2020)
VRARTIVIAVPAVAAVLAGCTNKDDRPTLAEPTTTTPATSAPVRATTRPAPPPTRTKQAATKDGPCPYFSTAFAQDTVGQHLARSTVITTTPYEGCVLYRPDGAKAVEIAVTTLATPLAAQQKAVSQLGASANPVRDVGDRATVLVGADGTRLVASKGRYLIEVSINQQSSLQAHDIAAAVASKVH